MLFPGTDGSSHTALDDRSGWVERCTACIEAEQGATPPERIDVCNLNATEKENVATAMRMLLGDGKPFTGRDVAQIAEVKAEIEASAYVRELFNKGEMPGWASTQAIPKKGPVVYFSVPERSLAGQKVKRIRKELSDADGARPAQREKAAG